MNYIAAELQNLGAFWKRIDTKLAIQFDPIRISAMSHPYLVKLNEHLKQI